MFFPSKTSFSMVKVKTKPPHGVPDDVLKNIQDVAVRTFSALDLKGYSRIDMFVRKDGRVAVLEPNTLPGDDTLYCSFPPGSSLRNHPDRIDRPDYCISPEISCKKKRPVMIRGFAKVIQGLGHCILSSIANLERRGFFLVHPFYIPSFPL